MIVYIRSLKWILQLYDKQLGYFYFAIPSCRMQCRPFRHISLVRIAHFLWESFYIFVFLLITISGSFFEIQGVCLYFGIALL